MGRPARRYLWLTAGMVGLALFASCTKGGVAPVGESLMASQGPPTANQQAAEHNDEGVSHFRQGQWSEAAKGFQDALMKDPDFAVAHFNLALTLDKMESHEEAAAHFQTAQDLAPNTKAIAENPTLLAHVGG